LAPSQPVWWVTARLNRDIPWMNFRKARLTHPTTYRKMRIAALPRWPYAGHPFQAKKLSKNLSLIFQEIFFCEVGFPSAFRPKTGLDANFMA
jgi:hypothetical protein